MLSPDFFDRDPLLVAQELLGKVLCVRAESLWLRAQIIETEAYYLADKASHASLGFTEKRKALFMPAGTIYMYYARGGDSLNVSCAGPGNAVLIKSGYPYLLNEDSAEMLAKMQALNPPKSGHKPRNISQLCRGQTLLCKSLGLKVPEWNQKVFTADCFFIADLDYRPSQIIHARRLGIPEGRDEHLLYRMVDSDFCHLCTQNPLRQRKKNISKEI